MKFGTKIDFDKLNNLNWKKLHSGSHVTQYGGFFMENLFFPLR